MPHRLRPAENVPAEAVERLAERAQRTPLFIVELVRGLKRQGLVRQRPGGSWYLATDELDRMPELRLVEWLAHHELGALPPELTAHARLCALLGGTSPAARWRAWCGSWSARTARPTSPWTRATPPAGWWSWGCWWSTPRRGCASATS